jgi:cell division protein FtsQ
MRARRAAVDRRRSWRRRAALVGAAAVAVLAVGAWFLLHSSLLSARVLVVRGAVHETPRQVLAAAGLTRRPPLVDIDPGASATRVEALPWVATASVARHWPDGVTVSVTERVPVTQMADPGAPAPAAWAELDRSGRVLARTAAPTPGLRLLTAPVHPGPPGSVLGAGARPGLLVLSTLPPAFGAQVTGVTVTAGDQVSLSLSSPLAVVLGDTSQLRAKYEDVASVLAAATLTAGDVIDVSVPESPTVTGG